ncbi:MAG: hypothetical protein EXS05_17480 [Planctomycetaceae bacterium]|nr:hypothetical protein [Planctomycetaceae bacterium]
MKWWLVTWSTYGSWLPGDPRGFQTWRGKEYVPPPKRYAKPGEQNYKAAAYTNRFQAAKAITDKPVNLSPAQRRITLDAVVKEINKLPVVSAVLAVAAEHSHLLAKFGGLQIRPTVGFLKGEATKELHTSGFDRNDPWAKGCHMKPKSEGNEFRVAFNYVRNHINEGAAVYIWPDFQHLITP